MALGHWAAQEQHDPEDLMKPIDEYATQGVREIYLHSPSPDEERVLTEVVPALLQAFPPAR